MVEKKKASPNKLKKLKNNLMKGVVSFKNHILQSQKKVNNNEISLLLLIATYILISLTAIYSSFNFFKTTADPQTLGENTKFYLEKEKAYWINYLKENPNYIDGWLELTKIEYEMGNIPQATRSLEKAKNINPNLLKVKNTEMELGL